MGRGMDIEREKHFIMQRVNAIFFVVTLNMSILNIETAPPDAEIA